MSGTRSGRSVVRRCLTLSALSTLLANLAGAVVVFVLLAFVLPLPDVADEPRVLLSNLVVASVYAVTAAVVGGVFSMVDAARRLRWLVEERTPTTAERRRTLRIPRASTIRQLCLWGLAAVGFTVLNARLSVLLGIEIGLTILIGGLTVSATTLLLLQRSGRPVVARALTGVALRRSPGASVAVKTVLTWGLGTGLPLVGLTLLSGVALGLEIPRVELARAVFVLGLTALGTGLLSILILARSLADPLRGLRRTLEAIQRGELDTDIAITDTTEVGVLQAGVNAMLAGLRERDRVRDLFGRHVGEDVARRALADGVELGGQDREVAALFVDVIDSTALAEQVDPQEVLRLLNEFFAVVVDVVDQHGGTVNKFLGDAALAIWGAPLDSADATSEALAAAREIGERLTADVPGLRAGVGVAAGTVVAGNLGASTRLEYTVIGDAVNVASRLSGRAKEVDGLVLADAAMLDDASAEEASRWVLDGEVTLRGRRRPTTLARPSPGGPISPGSA